jgi:hypothetical protein
MSGPDIPPDFGGFLGYWIEDHAMLVRYGKGKPIEGVSMTPLNLLQARKTLDALIAQGDSVGHITEEHRHQAAQLPSVEGLDEIIPRSKVDEIAGDQ